MFELKHTSCTSLWGSGNLSTLERCCQLLARPMSSRYFYFYRTLERCVFGRFDLVWTRPTAKICTSHNGITCRTTQCQAPWCKIPSCILASTLSATYILYWPLGLNFVAIHAFCLARLPFRVETTEWCSSSAPAEGVGSPKSTENMLRPANSNCFGTVWHSDRRNTMPYILCCANASTADVCNSRIMSHFSKAHLLRVRTRCARAHEGARACASAREKVAWLEEKGDLSKFESLIVPEKRRFCAKNRQQAVAAHPCIWEGDKICDIS